jgi:hypothetical protein
VSYGYEMNDHEIVYDSVGCFVGSANAKLDDDLKRASDSSEFSNSFEVEADTAVDCVKTQQNNNYVLDASRLANFIELIYGNKNQLLDFQLVKISCKKEYEPKKKSTWQKLVKFLKVTWFFRIALFLIVGIFIAFTVFQIVEYTQRTPDELYLAQNIDSEDFDEFIYSRNASKLKTRNIGQLKYEKDWIGEEIPAIYEIDPLTFYDSNADGFGDLNGVGLKLDYIQNVLKVNCIMLRNLNLFFDTNLNLFNIYGLDMIDEKIGTLSELENLISLANKRSIKVILEIDLTGTSRSLQYKDFYVSSNQRFLNDLNHSPRVFDSNAFAYLNYDNQTVI